MPVKPLSADKLCLRTDARRLPFDSTAKLPDATGPVGQDRAVRAIEFGAGIAQPGYNIFVTGPQSSGKHTSVRRILESLAAQREPPPDWCYVHNFAKPHRPQALRFAPGEGSAFRTAMAEFVEDLKRTMPRVYERPEYRRAREGIEKDFRAAVDDALDRLRKRAEAEGLALVERSEGIVFLPQRDGLVLSEEEYRKLPRDQRERIAEKTRRLRGELDRVFEQLEGVRETAVARLRELDREHGEAEVRRLLAPITRRFDRDKRVAQYLDAVFEDVLKHLDGLRAQGGDEEGERNREGGVPFHHYEVNLLVDNSETKSAPVVTLGLPTVSNLLGKIEHVPLLVTIVTDFMYVRPGALHKANGGFLLIDLRDLLKQDMSWEVLARSLKEARIKIESLAEMADRVATVSIQPEPIPLDLKVVLFGEWWLFHRLRQFDPEFADLFKVQADFGPNADRDDANCANLLRLLSSVAREGALRHLDRTGAARMLDEAARMAGDAEKITTRTGKLADLLREADHFAAEKGRSLIGAADIERAIAAKEDRAGRLKALEQELIDRKIVFIDTDGEKTGQVNAITVIETNGYAFGVPARITARVRPGSGEVVNIERLVDFSGPVHDKGVHIIAGYLNGTHSRRRALSLSASVAFEQTYGPIDGDSASIAELMAILSAIAEVPVRQSLAVTGSVNQHGEVQPVGAVNEKIQGFFDICAMRGLKRHHGVVIPRANVRNLMLRDDVIDAVRAGRFSIYAVSTVDEAIEVLTGMKAGTARRNGRFPRGTFNRRVSDQLTWFARPRHFPPLRYRRWWW